MIVYTLTGSTVRLIKIVRFSLSRYLNLLSDSAQMRPPVVADYSMRNMIWSLAKEGVLE
jgi:hypothetical protein